jgi:hypothetical protein
MQKRALPLISTALLISGLLILPGCFGGGGEEPTGSTGSSSQQLAFYRTVEANDFILQVPEDWETIQNFPSDYPENTVVAFRNNNKDHEFVANINIVRNDIEAGTSASDYGIEVFRAVSEQLVNFNKLGQTEVEIPTGGPQVANEEGVLVDPSEITYLFEFEGTNSADARTRGFIQAYGISGTTGYIVTGTYALSDIELAIDQVKQSVATFQMKLAQQ